MLETEQLRHFVTVAEYGSLTKAATELFVSHSTLSRSIRRTERDLGVRLFERRKNRLLLNDNGRELLRGAREILEQIRTLEETMHTRAHGLKNQQPLA